MVSNSVRHDSVQRYDVIKGNSLTPSPSSKPTEKPTNMPVGLCGNSICDVSEDSLSCPSDCTSVNFLANDIGAKGKQHQY
jgi:hypothetical protein